MEKTVGEQKQAIGIILEEYGRIACFLEKETVFKARPLHITVDGPYSIGASLEVSLSAEALTSRDV